MDSHFCSTYTPSWSVARQPYLSRYGDCPVRCDAGMCQNARRHSPQDGRPDREGVLAAAQCGAVWQFSSVESVGRQVHCNGRLEALWWPALLPTRYQLSTRSTSSSLLLGTNMEAGETTTPIRLRDLTSQKVALFTVTDCRTSNLKPNNIIEPSALYMFCKFTHVCTITEPSQQGSRLRPF